MYLLNIHCSTEAEVTSLDAGLENGSVTCINVVGYCD